MEFHPFAERFPLLAGQEWETFKTSIQSTNGPEQPVLYRLIRGKKQGLDGRNRWLACEELHLRCREKLVAVKDADVREFILRRNVHRRHLTAEQRQALVAELRADGKTTRAIAGALGVSQRTVIRDLSVESKDSTEPKNAEQPAVTAGRQRKVENGSGQTVTGKDGKTYPAKKTKPEVLCDRCQRVGKQKGCEACKDAKATAKKMATHSRGLGVPDKVMDAEPEIPKEETSEDVMARTNTEKEVFARKITALIDEIPKDPWIDNDMNVRGSIAEKLKNAAGLVRSTKCPKKCPMCRGEGCRSCYSTGRVTQGKYQQLV